MCRWCSSTALSPTAATLPPRTSTSTTMYVQIKAAAPDESRSLICWIWRSGDNDTVRLLTALLLGWRSRVDHHFVRARVAHDSRSRLLLLWSCQEKVGALAHLALHDVGCRCFLPGEKTFPQKHCEQKLIRNSGCSGASRSPSPRRPTPTLVTSTTLA